MTRSTRIINSVFMLFSASCAFLFGFIQAGVFPDAAQNGVLIGIISATALGIGSMGASAPFSGWANIFAALFAAMSLGFLAPADDACRNAHLLAAGACELRASLR